MQTARLILLWVMGLFYIAAGVNHFISPRFYLKIIPPYLPWHNAINIVSGAAEVILGILVLIPATRVPAAWGLIALLIAIFPANLYVFQHQEILPAPGWVHLLRLPLQGVLILWAWWYTR